MSIPLIFGTAEHLSVPDGDQTELIMLDSSANKNAVLEAHTDKYAVIPRNGQGIDFMAQIVKDYHGFVTGFNGHNGMFDASGMITDWSKVDWGHAVYVCGYEMHEGKKCLVFKNSWGSKWGTDGYGYFPEGFVTSGLMFDAYVYSLVEDLDPNSIMLTNKNVRELYRLAFYREPDASELAYWTGKLIGDFLEVAIKDRAAFLAQPIV